MPEAASERYQSAWRPRRYLEQYYSTGATSDDVAQARFAMERLRDLGRALPTALEVGCGPTPHHAFSIAPFVQRLTLADYLPSNLEEARLWVDAHPSAFDSDLLMTGMLAAELDVDPNLAAVVLPDRQRLLRACVREYALVDILRDPPLGEPRAFDLVASYYCLEALGLDHDAWRAGMRRLANLVAPGGALLLGAMRNASMYRVFEQEYPVTRVNEVDFAALLPELGFEPTSIRVDVAASPEFASEGFDSVCCVFGVKPG